MGRARASPLHGGPAAHSTEGSPLRPIPGPVHARGERVGAGGPADGAAGPGRGAPPAAWARSGRWQRGVGQAQQRKEKQTRRTAGARPMSRAPEPALLALSKQPPPSSSLELHQVVGDIASLLAPDVLLTKQVLRRSWTRGWRKEPSLRRTVFAPAFSRTPPNPRPHSPLPPFQMCHVPK